MGKAKHTRISQRMSQHIMWLKLSLGILASKESKEITYQDDMFIAHMNSLVNTFFLSQCLPVLPHSLTAQILSAFSENRNEEMHMCSLIAVPASADIRQYTVTISVPETGRTRMEASIPAVALRAQSRAREGRLFS